MENTSISTLQNSICGYINYFSFDEREYYLKQFGEHSQSFTTLQPGLQYFDVPGCGYIAFTKKFGVTIALSDPVSHVSDFEIITKLFYKKYANAVHVQVSPLMIEILHNQLGCFLTQIGVEYKIYLKEWNSKGKSKKSIRQAVNQAEKQGIRIQEQFNDIPLQKMSSDWLKTRSCKKEIDFLIRPMNMPYSEGVRCFCAYKDDKAVGFILFDPIYKNGRIIGYIPNISRSWNGFQQGLWYAMMIKAMNTFREENIYYVDLGLTPLSMSKNIMHHESNILRKVLKLIYQYGNFIYNFQGLEFAKQRFKGEVTNTYAAHKSSLPLWALIALFKKCRII